MGWLVSNLAEEGRGGGKESLRGPRSLFSGEAEDRIEREILTQNGGIEWVSVAFRVGLIGKAYPPIGFLLHKTL